RPTQPVSFFPTRARNPIACAKMLVEKPGGEVPRTLEELVPLPGVGRKTANVVLGNAYGIPALPVDTHVRRLSQRLGLTHQTEPVKIEQDLTQMLPAEEWVPFSLRLILHGRPVCNARKPRCESCGMESFCPKVGVKPKEEESAGPPR